jgi:pimeloyl-ACP methyl ester carboxylesterase
MSEALQVRVHGDASLPTLVYLPGTHGDWTLVGGFRRALGGRVRFVEITYPRTVRWSLEDYAAETEAGLGDHGILRGWLLGESFGSQVVWTMVARKQFQPEGVILAGGFVRHPMPCGTHLAARICGSTPLWLMRGILLGYARTARLRFRRSPDTLEDIQAFMARRTELDLAAAVHRLHLIAQNDARPIARQANVPVYALSGVLDPIVPWFVVRPWLRRHCAALCDCRIIWHADHNVLSTAPEAAARQVLRWLTEKRICLGQP